MDHDALERCLSLRVRRTSESALSAMSAAAFAIGQETTASFDLRYTDSYGLNWRSFSLLMIGALIVVGIIRALIALSERFRQRIPWRLLRSGVPSVMLAAGLLLWAGSSVLPDRIFDLLVAVFTIVNLPALLLTMVVNAILPIDLTTW